jgi:stage V sporulation protein AC
MKRTEDFKNQNYLDYVSSVSPKTKEFRSLLRAFLVGGFICTIGQSVKFILESFFNLPKDQLSAFTSMIMVFLGAFLTGLGVYDRIGKFAGCGSIVPITGFANSVVSPSMEFKSEGFVYGTASKMFVIAGPIIVFGVCSSVLVGLIYFIIYSII